MSGACTLADLLDGFAIAEGGEHVEVRGLRLDSREVAAGDAFFALAGERTHGLEHASVAIDAGAAAVLFEPPVPVGLDVPERTWAVPGLRSVLGAIASRFHGEPSRQLTVVGVTGTNGKTSTVHLLGEALHLGGTRVGSIGTLGAGLRGALEPGPRTTPDVLAVHRLLAKMRDDGATHVAMEVSSHALAQGRVDSVLFDTAVFTNLSRDHLDYHRDMRRYAEAKALLFRSPGLRAAVVNLDDPLGREIHAGLPAALQRVGLSSHGHPDACLQAGQIRLDGAGLAFELVEDGDRREVASPLLGRFNVDNLLAVAGVLRAMQRPLPDVAALLSQLRPVRGRMTGYGGGAGKPLVVVDYAHTPDALEQALASLRGHLRGRLACVFGCGGERDRGKRPQMAAVAARLADRVIVTDDNPRHEDGGAIVAGILAGFDDPDAVTVERDRARAIATAVSAAAEGDIVLVAGKGHETYQEIAGVRVDFDDGAVVRGLLERRR